MLVTADALVAHAVGDYILQSSWMATEKTKRNLAAAAHAVTYSIPFLLLTRSPLALAFIAGTHFVVDRWRLARYVVWARNFLAPKHVFKVGIARVPPTVMFDFKDLEVEAQYQRNHPWSECSKTGEHEDKPDWLAVWLLIVVDNILHVLLNALALRYL